MRGLLPLLCVTLWAAEVPGTPLKTEEGRSKPAFVEDVNVLMYGVLQFSDAIHHIYQETRGRMSRIHTLLLRQEGELQQLQEEVGQATQKEEEIRTTLSQLQTQTAGLHTHTMEMRTEVQKAEREQVELQNQVISLETSLERPAPNITTLKDLALEHSNILKVLEEWVQEEKRTLKDQDQQLTHMQSLTES
ncbi:hypothetical protein SKAU_G00419840 [Synaphobranchus kaupii]|uniref:Uncharacterized protein n=1 Tax=Synaphobranchus kaupii TaxID=118154 RepID=A0A9Q1I952_SYNKA|nr:hypothetical protein SKAU_G00419840 [Synaphobranchus kaupii]